MTTGRAAVVIRHLPLEAIHPVAFDAAVAAECARQQRRFEEFHDLLFERQRDLPGIAADGFALVATALNLDVDVFAACVAGSEATERVRADVTEAQRLGLNATPTVMVGRRVAGGMQPAARLSGPLTAAGVQERIEAVLSDGEPSGRFLRYAGAGSACLGLVLLSGLIALRVRSRRSSSCR